MYRPDNTTEAEEREQLSAWLKEIIAPIDHDCVDDAEMHELRKMVDAEYDGGLHQFWTDGGY